MVAGVLLQDERPDLIDSAGIIADAQDADGLRLPAAASQSRPPRTAAPLRALRRGRALRAGRVRSGRRLRRADLPLLRGPRPGPANAGRGRPLRARQRRPGQARRLGDPRAAQRARSTSTPAGAAATCCAATGSCASPANADQDARLRGGRLRRAGCSSTAAPRGSSAGPGAGTPRRGSSAAELPGQRPARAIAARLACSAGRAAGHGGKAPSQRGSAQWPVSLSSNRFAVVCAPPSGGSPARPWAQPTPSQALACSGRPLQRRPLWSGADPAPSVEPPACRRGAESRRPGECRAQDEPTSTSDDPGNERTGMNLIWVASAVAGHQPRVLRSGALEARPARPRCRRARR